MKQNRMYWNRMNYSGIAYNIFQQKRWNIMKQNRLYWNGKDISLECNAIEKNKIERN